MRDDEATCLCWTMGTQDQAVTAAKKDPSALGHRQHPKMASGDGGARHGRAAAEPDAGIPGHVGPEKQLHSGTGYNLVIDTQKKIYGTREPYNKEAIMEVTAREPGEVQIRGKESKFYLAMDEKGKVYAEENGDSSNTWFKETFEDGWNYYLWLGNNKEWYLGIKKSGKIKHGSKTKKKQKSVKFVPRSAIPSYT